MRILKYHFFLMQWWKITVKIKLFYWNLNYLYKNLSEIQILYPRAIRKIFPIKARMIVHVVVENLEKNIRKKTVFSFQNLLEGKVRNSQQFFRSQNDIDTRFSKNSEIFNSEKQVFFIYLWGYNRIINIQKWHSL